MNSESLAPANPENPPGKHSSTPAQDAVERPPHIPLSKWLDHFWNWRVLAASLLLLWLVARHSPNVAVETVSRWAIGVFVVAVGGGHALATSTMNRLEKRLEKEKRLHAKHHQEYVPSWLSGEAIGILESIFFAIAVANELSGTFPAMIGWTTVKSQAHWALFSKNGDHVRGYIALVGGVCSMLCATVGGLICGKDALWTFLVWKSVDTGTTSGSVSGPPATSPSATCFGLPMLILAACAGIAVGIALMLLYQRVRRGGSIARIGASE